MIVTTQSTTPLSIVDNATDTRPQSQHQHHNRNQQQRNTNLIIVSNNAFQSFTWVVAKHVGYKGTVLDTVLSLILSKEVLQHPSGHPHLCNNHIGQRHQQTPTSSSVQTQQ